MLTEQTSLVCGAEFSVLYCTIIGVRLVVNN